MSTTPAPQRGHLETSEGVRLYYETDPVAKPRAALFFVHGFGDHCDRYASMAETLGEAGYACYRFDYRGHGRSDGPRGHIFSFDDYLRDLSAFVDRFREETAGRPRILMGHSNGGLIALHWQAHNPGTFDALVLSSPFFGFQIKVPTWKKVIGRTLSRYLPALAMPTDLDPAWVSHDPEVVEAMANDPLKGTVATARWLTETTRAHEEARARARDVVCPVLLQQAGDDKIASSVEAREVFDLLGSEDRTWVEYEGLYHEVWFELERGRTQGELRTWLDLHTEA